MSTCTEVLSEDRQNAKALFRRGCARHRLGQHEEAEQDLAAALAAAPGDAGIARELKAVRQHLREVSCGWGAGGCGRGWGWRGEGLGLGLEAGSWRLG